LWGFPFFRPALLAFFTFRPALLGISSFPSGTKKNFLFSARWMEKGHFPTLQPWSNTKLSVQT